MYACCKIAPKREFIQAVLNLSNLPMPQRWNSVLNYTNVSGNNCLMITLELMLWHHKSMRKFPTSSTGLFEEIESTLLFLIEQGDIHGLDMIKILNWRNKSGNTLFSRAVVYSEKISSALLERDVFVNTVDCQFSGPWLKWSKVRWLKVR